MSLSNYYNNDNIPEQPFVLNGKVSENRRTFKDRFPDRSYNFIGNAWSDIKDTVSGMAQLLGQGLKTFTLGEKLPEIHNASGLLNGKGFDERDSQWGFLHNLGEGLKENYGQKDIDMVNWERVKDGQLPIQVDLPGLAQSFYAHPLNLLDIVGIGELGKIKNVAKVTKGGEVSQFSKAVGNKTLSPKYSKNLVFNGSQRLLETKPVQNIVKVIDNSPLRPTTDIAADFLGLSPDSRLMGTKGAEVRQAKLIEQANQTKNIAERNKAIAENQKLLSGLSENEAKELINSIESGKTLFKPKDISDARKDISNFDFNKTNNGINISTPKEWKNLSLKEIQDKAVEVFRAEIQPNTINHKELGEMYSNKFSRHKYGTNASNDYRYRIAKELEYIVKNAEYITTEKAIPGKKNGFIKVHKLGKQVNIDGNPVNFLIEIGEDTKGNLFYDIDTIKDGSSRAKRLLPNPSFSDNDIITNFSKISTPRMREVKNLLKNKVNKNAEYYLKEGLLSEETIKELPVNTYASIKYNKPIIELTDAEKLNALNDINKMPAEQRPFYVPKMYEDKLKLSDFFNKDIIGDNRIYDPVKIANRLDLNRISLINAENMINEIIENFAKPLNLSKGNLLDGYVPFKPYLGNNKIYQIPKDVAKALFYWEHPNSTFLDTSLSQGLLDSVYEVSPFSVKGFNYLDENALPFLHNPDKNLIQNPVRKVKKGK